jgi:hypothetical protein
MCGVRSYLIRLWVHEAEDGFLPEATVTAASAEEAAALALREFQAMGRCVTQEGYLECEPRGDKSLRVRDVIAWQTTDAGVACLRRHATASMEC